MMSEDPTRYVTPAPIAAHRYRVETLHHYRCAVCARGWTIGDPTTASMLTCPACGARRQLRAQ